MINKLKRTAIALMNFKLQLIAPRVMLVALAVTASSPCWSANWKSLDGNFLVDLQSGKKQGDLGTVDIMYKDETMNITFDCKQRAVLSPSIWADRKPISDNQTPISEMLEAACKNWYEVWKR